MSTIFSKADLKNIRDLLPEDGVSILAKEFKMSAGSIRNILFGQHENIKVCRKALEMANAEKEVIENQKQAIA